MVSLKLTVKVIHQSGEKYEEKYLHKSCCGGAGPLGHRAAGGLRGGARGRADHHRDGADQIRDGHAQRTSGQYRHCPPGGEIFLQRHGTGYPGTAGEIRQPDDGQCDRHLGGRKKSLRDHCGQRKCGEACDDSGGHSRPGVYDASAGDEAAGDRSGAVRYGKL